jgi:hypothetical protein
VCVGAISEKVSDMEKNARPLLGTGLEDELILQYDTDKYPWREIISEILQVRFSDPHSLSEMILSSTSDCLPLGRRGSLESVA